MKLPISVYIIVKNEEDRIAEAIKSVQDFADEIWLIDSGSSDRTLEIASSLGAKTIFNEWKGFGPQKIFGEQICRNNWLLNIDADERISPDLASEITDVFLAGEHKKYSAFLLKHHSFFWFETKPQFLARSRYICRLYNKNFAGMRNSTVLDSVIVRHGKTKKLKSYFVECSLRSFEHAIAKINAYSSMQAKELSITNFLPRFLLLPVIHLLSFWKAFLFRRYCFYGSKGYVLSQIYAMSRLLKYAKCLEKFEAEKASKKHLFFKD